jgi:hypothetical protein
VANALASIASVLDGLAIDWMLFGALAANLYRAETRLTGDTDVMLANVGPSLSELESALNTAGWTVFRATPDGSLLRVRHPELGVADLVIAGTEFERLALSRASFDTTAEGVRLRVPTREDAIIFKLIAGRAKDLADVESILDTDPQLDEAYIGHWTTVWEVTDRWQSIRAASRRE